MSQNQREPDDGFAATAKDIKAIKAVVAEIAQAEDGTANLYMAVCGEDPPPGPSRRQCT